MKRLLTAILILAVGVSISAQAEVDSHAKKIIEMVKDGKLGKYQGHDGILRTPRVSGDLDVDVINEHTSGSGTTVDGVVLKDSILRTAAGALNLVAVGINSTNDGFYALSGVQIGVAVNGTLVGIFDTSGLSIGEIGEQVTDVGTTFANLVTLSSNLTVSGTTVLMENIPNVAVVATNGLQSGQLYRTNSTPLFWP